MKTLSMSTEEYDKDIKAAEKRGVEKGYPTGYTQGLAEGARQFAEFLNENFPTVPIEGIPYQLETSRVLKEFIAAAKAPKTPKSLS